MILQTIGHYKELLVMCQSILNCVQNADPVLVYQLQQQVFTLRWRLAQISLEVRPLCQRIAAMIEKL